MSDDMLPSIDDLPVLPDMTSSMDLDLAIDDKGEVYVFHTQPFPEPLDWAEYDSDGGRLFFVSEEGRIQGLGLDVYNHMQERLLKAQRIFTLHVEDGVVRHVSEIPLISGC